MKFNKLIPELSVSNFDKSLKFYTELGFKTEYTREKFAFLSFQGSQIMIEEINYNWKVGNLEYPFGCGVNFQINCDNADKLVNVIKKNYKIFRGPEDNWYRKGKKLLGQREFLIQDLDGYLLRFAQYIGEK